MVGGPLRAPILRPASKAGRPIRFHHKSQNIGRPCELGGSVPGGGVQRRFGELRGRLPLRLQEVLLLHYGMDLPLTSCAEALGISEPLARKRKQQAKDMLTKLAYKDERRSSK